MDFWAGSLWKEITPEAPYVGQCVCVWLLVGNKFSSGFS